jgi:hypothetical protein
MDNELKNKWVGEVIDEKQKLLIIKDFDNVEDITSSDVNNKRLVYDIFTKSFIPYDEYTKQYNQKMYGVNYRPDEENLKAKDDIKYFD